MNTSAHRPRLLLDVDGVLADFVGGCARSLERLGWHEHVPTLRADYDFFRHLPPEVKHHLHRSIAASGFCSSLEVYAHAREAVRELEALADVYIVTSPWWSSPHWVSERLSWLHQHFGIDRDRVVFTHAKHVVLGDHFVDDHQKHTDAWALAHPNGVVHRWPWKTPAEPSHWIAVIDAVRASR